MSSDSLSSPIALNTLIGGIALYSFSSFCAYSLKSRSEKLAIIEAEKAKSYSPATLLKKLAERTTQKPESLKEFTLISAKPSAGSSSPEIREIRGRAFMSGIVKCDQPLHGFDYFPGDFRNKGLIYRARFDEDRYSLKPQPKLRESSSIESAPKNAVVETVDAFALADQYGGAASCDVQINKNINANLALQLIEQKDKLITVSLVSRVIGTILATAKAITGVLSGTTSPIARAFKGIKIGMTEKEIGIKVGSLLTVYGEFTFNLDTGRLSCNAPAALVLDKGQMIYRMKEALVITNQTRNIFGVILAGTLVYFGVKIYYNFFKAMPTQKQIPTPSSSQILSTDPDNQFD